MSQTVFESSPVALVLAGGRGSRLAPLTDYQPKPAVSLGGSYSMIDVVLSNLTHSGIRDVWIVEQYQPWVINKHLAGGRPWDLDGTRGGLRVMPPAENGSEDDTDGFSEGNGHVLYQQLDELDDVGADTVIVASADHLYFLDIRPVIQQHHKRGSDLTIVSTTIEDDASRYGVVTASRDGVVTDYAYKPDNPSGQTVATEVFIFNVAALRKVIETLLKSLDDPAELGDYGETIVPALVDDSSYQVHDFRMQGYWRDLGTIDSYFQAHQDMIDGAVRIDDPAWPLITNSTDHSPARVSSNDVSESLICPGANVAGSVHRSVIGPGAVIEKGASVNRCVINRGAVVPAGAQLDSVIVDKHVTVPAQAIGKTKPGPGNIEVLVPEQD